MRTFFTDQQTETVVWRRALSVMFSVICYAHLWRKNHLCDQSIVAYSCGRCYDNSERSLVVVSTLLLKGAESFWKVPNLSHRPVNAL